MSFTGLLKQIASPTIAGTKRIFVVTSHGLISLFFSFCPGNVLRLYASFYLFFGITGSLSALKWKRYAFLAVFRLSEDRVPVDDCKARFPSVTVTNTDADK
jgi:hypothetical protein